MQRQRGSFVVFLIIGIVLIVAAGGGVLYYSKAREAREAGEAREKADKAAAGINVTVAKSQKGPNFRKITLVGEALPHKSVTLYSKVSGYLSRINVDVGDVVKQGQVIAEVTSPELDAQVATINAGLSNKRQIAKRTRELAGAGFFSQQALDTADTDVRVAEAQIAEVRTLSSYRTLRAPFAGVVTARYADLGALVTNAASNQTSALPLVTIADTSKLKITVYAEQAEAPVVKVGLDVDVIDAAAPERKVSGKIARTSGELDTRTRTLRTEVEFDNSEGRFIAGSFVNASLLIPATSFIEVPAGALVTKDKKPFVVIVGKDGKAHFVPIVVAGTDGKVLRIASGLDEGVVVAVSPPASLAEGAKVNPQTPPGAPPAPPKSAEAPKPADAPKSAEAPKAMDAPKPAEAPKAMDASKAADTGAKPAQPPKPAASPKADAAKPADPPKK